MQKELSVILGIDGGGTKTVAALANVDSAGLISILGRGTAGSSNIKAVGEAAVCTAIANAIHAAWQAAGLATSAVEQAVLGLSGAGRSEDQDKLVSWMSAEGLARQSQVVHDAYPVLAAGCDADWGIALVAGTGAVAYGRNSAGDVHVAGGWGYWFGDEGSAYWIGRAALARISQTSDGRADSTALVDRVLEHLQLAEPRAILSELARRGDVRQQIADLAALVSDVAAYDGPARQILLDAGTNLADLVEATARRLGITREFPLAMAGGVLTHCQTVRDQLLEESQQRELIPLSTAIVEEPVQGCLKLAAKALLASG